MDARELRRLRRSRELLQRTAAHAWGVAPNTVYRWGAGLRPIPAWLDKMIERGKPLLRKIESQEKEIADLLLKIHRMPDPRPARRPIAAVRTSGRTAAFGGGRRTRA